MNISFPAIVNGLLVLAFLVSGWTIAVIQFSEVLLAGWSQVTKHAITTLGFLVMAAVTCVAIFNSDTMSSRLLGIIMAVAFVTMAGHFGSKAYALHEKSKGFKKQVEREFGIKLSRR